MVSFVCDKIENIVRKEKMLDAEISAFSPTVF